MSKHHMHVWCGSLRWAGKAYTVEHAVIVAFSKRLPSNPSPLVRINDGKMNYYLDFSAAMKIAGYTPPKRRCR